jgi:hypothetical protein
MKNDENDLLKNQKAAIASTKNPRIWLTDWEKLELEKSGLALRAWTRVVYGITIRVWLYWRIADWEKQKADHKIAPKITPLPTYRESVENIESGQRTVKFKPVRRYVRNDVPGHSIMLLKTSCKPPSDEINIHQNLDCPFLEGCTDFAKKHKFFFSCNICPQAKNLEKEK